MFRMRLNSSLISLNVLHVDLLISEKLGTGERVASVVGFGIFSKKINKTWKCNNCGYTW